ncbi:MAG TPA: AgmX/PglI C-terminal domain-containing protein [Myxococcaceae bacterium]|nr:AgmX/PglI C-terminal domain-containing protein [Myxococcaceae bacterium]
MPRDENVIISCQLFDALEPPRRPGPAPARSAAAAKRRPPLPIRVPSIRADARGAPRLYLELYWGDIRREARSFRRDKKKPVLAGGIESAPMPLWGFSLGDEPYVLAESAAKGFRLYVPPRSSAFKKKDDAFHQVGPRELEADGSRRFISLTKGAAARLSEGQMTLVAYVAPKPARVWVNPFRGLPWLAMFFFALFGSGLIYFILFGPKPPEMADFTGKHLAPVAVRLLAPQPKKKEEAKKKLEALKEEAKKKEEVKEEKKEEKKKVVKEKVREPPKQKVVVDTPPPPETKALKALAKLSAAGPATGDILAAVDKLGAGPGSKNVKNNYKLSGLIGKAPIANAGLGTFGLGGGGRGGAGMLGAEILHGKGGGGIGAMGAGGVGRGAVGGTVTRASARNVSVQGSIDREAVAKVVNAHLQEVRGCYERALLRDPALAGKVVLEWTIALSGKVNSSRTKSSTLKNSAVEACILQSLNTWQFPPAKGGVVIVSYPFLFNSVGY